jgi:hypothetical protein
MSVIDRIDRRLGNMRMMLQRLEIDLVAFSRQNQGRFLASAIPTCQDCSCDEECHDWLARASASLQQAPAFCPNAQLFAWAKEDQSQSRPAELPR